MECPIFKEKFRGDIQKKTKIGFVSGRFYSDSTELRMIYRFITETSFQYGNKFIMLEINQNFIFN